MKKATKTKPENKEKKIIVKAIFSGENIYSNKKEAFALYEQSRFGEPKEGKVYYSFYEALFLIDKGKLTIEYKKSKLGFDKILDKLKDLDKKIETKYSVFKDMRSRGYIVKTALKFGAEFRVYDKGVKPGEEHARWILYPVKESETLTWHDFSAKNRVAHSTKKNLLIGIVDEENDVTYYQVSWIKP
mgnify:CR=1 FL=1